MKKLSTLVLITALFCSACNSKTDKKTVKQSTTEAEVNDTIAIAPPEESFTAKTDLLANLPVRHFPIIDSTSFDNFEKSGIPDNGFLKRIKFDPRRKDATDFRLHYKIPFSEGFTAVVVSYQCGEHELFTTLITVNKASEIIDKLEIAYDEVAESAFGKTSKVEKDKIMITSSNWMSEEPVFETETYILQVNGKFNKVQAGSMQE